jgi:hypothetical protein
LLLLCVRDGARDGVARPVHPAPRIVTDGRKAAESSGEGAAEMVEGRRSHFVVALVFVLFYKKKVTGCIGFHLNRREKKESRQSEKRERIALLRFRPLSSFPVESPESLSRT